MKRVMAGAAVVVVASIALAAGVALRSASPVPSVNGQSSGTPNEVTVEAAPQAGAGPHAAPGDGNGAPAAPTYPDKFHRIDTSTGSGSGGVSVQRAAGSQDVTCEGTDPCGP